MKLSTLTTLIAAGLTVAAVTTTTARAEGRLVIYCSATNAFCEEEAKAFGEKYDVKTSFILSLIHI